MTTRVLLEPVFVLHTRPYQNSSLIVELLSMRHGRVAAIARSARGPKSRYKGCLQNFSPLLASWSGRRELMGLNHVESRGLAYQLSGQSLLSAFYLNELLLRLLPRDDAYPQIFADYQTTLGSLESTNELQISLRRFEKRLLEHLGYGMSFDVVPQAFYQWLPDQGFLRCEQSAATDRIFSGSSLLALQNENWDNPEDLVAAKRLMRLVLARHLGPRPLKSRELFGENRRVV